VRSYTDSALGTNGASIVLLFRITFIQRLLHWNIRGVSKQFGEWYQKTNKTADTNKLSLLAFKIIAVLHNTLLATFTKLLETVSNGLFRNRSQNRCHTFLVCRHMAAHQECVTANVLYTPRRIDIKSGKANASGHILVFLEGLLVKQGTLKY
jgi:hypothetical protein